MANIIYPYELTDPDFSWLISNFLEAHPNSISLEVETLPVVLLLDSASSKNECKEDNFATKTKNFSEKEEKSNKHAF